MLRDQIANTSTLTTPASRNCNGLNLPQSQQVTALAAKLSDPILASAVGCGLHEGACVGDGVVLWRH